MTSERFTRELPRSIAAEINGDIAILRLARPDKRNALDDEMIEGIYTFFRELPGSIKAAVLDAQGEHFSAGLDLSELTNRTTLEAIGHNSWEAAYASPDMYRWMEDQTSARNRARADH